MAAWPYNTGRWQRLRRQQLRACPFCEGCKARDLLTVANHIDHRRPISDGGDAFPSLDGLASLCASCHSSKTARGIEAGAVKTSKPRKGCDANGNPLDPRHPWGASQ